MSDEKFGLIYQDNGEWKIRTGEGLGTPANPAPELHTIITGLFEIKHKLEAINEPR